MHTVSYSVLCTLPDLPTARSYKDWLTQGHVQAVLAGGATGVEVVELISDDPRPRIEVRYSFEDQAAFDRYEKVHAPALRADGAARFGSIPGVWFERRIGSVIFRSGSGVEPL
ncbi:MAG TPA: DUF4286 family protein [Phycisphaerales bacterium]|nr:DUF4286 family protein [Phycisphaerales bacterium]